MPGANTLDVYVVDVEGGKSMLVVTPSGQAVLVDAGWAGLNNEKWVVTQPDDRDTDRIVEVVKLAKLKQIDYFVVTHYDGDHVGNVPRVVAKLPVPVLNFVDHGEPLTQNKAALNEYQAYLDTINKAKAKRISVQPGDRIPMKELGIVVVTSAGKVVGSPLPGAGAANPLCAGLTPGKPGRGENPASVGLLYTFGNFRMIDFADATKDLEYDLMCPNNPVGTVDLLMVSHHGFDASNSPQLIHALHPRVAIMNNGAKKFATPPAFQVIKSSPGLDDLWQMHYALDAGVEDNAPENLIANPGKEPDPKCFGGVLGDQGKWIKVSAQSDGTFTVVNSRNNHSKTYKSRK
jgi:beta-lactamase superfamily II metal-dependent hydrolase